MADVSSLIASVDKTFDTEIKKAKKDFKERIDAINGIYDMPDAIISLGGVSRSSLAQGGLGEARKVRRECAANMEKAVDKALKEMDSLKGKPENGSAIIRLTERLEDWIIRFKDLEIPASKHTSAEGYSAGSKYETALKKWQDFCKNDPLMKKAKLYDRKAALEKDVKALREKKLDIEEALPRKQAELDDRKNNGSKYEDEVREQVQSELDDLDTKIRRAKQDVSDKEFEVADLQQQLSKAGLFAMGKKKELRAQIESKAAPVEEAKKVVANLEKDRKNTEDSLLGRLSDLKTKILSLGNEIADDSNELVSVTSQLNGKLAELDKVNEDISK